MMKRHYVPSSAKAQDLVILPFGHASIGFPLTTVDDFVDTRRPGGIWKLYLFNWEHMYKNGHCSSALNR